MRQIIALIVLIIFALCSGCYAKKAFSGRNIGLLEDIRSISLKDSTIIFINSPVMFKNDEENNNLIIETSQKMPIRKISKDQVNTINSRHYSFKYALKARKLGWLYFFLQLL